MLSIEKCYALLNSKEKKYTKEQAIAIREQLYQFVKIIDEIKPD
jgi:hypothetical protein